MKDADLDGYDLDETITNIIDDLDDAIANALSDDNITLMLHLRSIKTLFMEIYKKK